MDDSIEEMKTALDSTNSTGSDITTVEYHSRRGMRTVLPSYKTLLFVAVGDKTSMTTYRDEVSGSGDATRWFYDAASGVVTNKVYADGKGPSYAYTDNGALAVRTWARGVTTSVCHRTYIYQNGKLIYTNE